MVEWAVPENRKQLQQFLRLANFYWCFIQDFSKVVTPLTQLTSTSQPFSWSLEANKAFLKLKTLFSSASVLVHTDLTKQFIVEVDASDTRVGSALSQFSENKLHLCAFYSCHMSPAEQNYNVGDRELL